MSNSDRLAGQSWDAVVIGAGPAGAVLAKLLAARGLAVLLVDKARFPRPKPCGGCLNRAALVALEAAGLGALPAQLGAVALHRFELHSGGRRARLPLPGGMALSRLTLDAALVEAAQRAGASFLPTTHAHAGLPTANVRPVRLRWEEGEGTVLARVVVVASGLGPLPADDAANLPAHPHPRSRLGAGAVAPVAPPDVPAGAIVMVHGQQGYLGLVRAEGGQLVAAAAFDPDVVRGAGGAGEAAAHLAAAVSPGWAKLARSLRWRGTPPLTFRRSRLASQRLFLLGDATGYVEPFTGEGMAWGLTSAVALAPIVTAAAAHWDEGLVERWHTLHRAAVGRRQRLCRIIAAALRRPHLTAAAVAALALLPPLAAPVVNALNAAPRWAPVS